MDGSAVTTDGGTISGMNPRPRNSAVTRIALAAGVILILGGAVAAALAGFGHRWGWWAFTAGFVVLRWAVNATVVGLVSPGEAWVRRNRYNSPVADCRISIIARYRCVKLIGTRRSQGAAVGRPEDLPDHLRHHRAPCAPSLGRRGRKEVW